MTLTKTNKLLFIAFTVILITVICFSLFAPVTSARAATPSSFSVYLNSIGAYLPRTTYLFTDDGFSSIRCGFRLCENVLGTVTKSDLFVLDFSSLRFGYLSTYQSTSKATFYLSYGKAFQGMTPTSTVRGAINNNARFPITLPYLNTTSLSFSTFTLTCGFLCDSSYGTTYKNYAIYGSRVLSAFVSDSGSVTDGLLTVEVEYSLIDLSISSTLEAAPVVIFPVTYQFSFFKNGTRGQEYVEFAPVVLSSDNDFHEYSPLQTYYTTYKQFVAGGGEAYLEGYNDGQDVGFKSGQSYGESIGFDKGFDAGVQDANGKVNKTSASYAAGYNDGTERAGNYTFRSLIGAVIDVPLNAFTSMFNFEILGVNISSLLSSLLVIALVMCVLKIVFSFM